MTCENCDRLIDPEDERTRHIWPTRGEPGYTESGCRFCTPSARELDAARDDAAERRGDQIREGV